MKDKLFAALLVLLIVAIPTLAIYMKVSVWNECRADHSWFYCIHLISK